MLYIGNDVRKVQSGADQVNKRNLSLFTDLFEGKLKIFPVAASKTLFSRFFFGIDKIFISAVFSEIKTGGYDIVFLSQSLLGRIAKKIKKNYPRIIVISFFHNIEKHYASELIFTSGFFHLPFYIAATYCERLTVKYSDHFILLNKRDNNLLSRFYKRTASLLLPTSFKDKLDTNKMLSFERTNEIIYLFVGVAFFANIHGINWFIDNVFPHVPGKLFIVGKGMGKVFERRKSERILIWDYVENLSDFYYQANLVVLPVFVGGGMKTKTAEAFMYGKTVLASSESLQGYEVCEGAVYRCDTKEEYINVINELILEDKISLYNAKSRFLFEKYYSYDYSKKSLQYWIDNLNKTNE